MSFFSSGSKWEDAYLKLLEALDLEYIEILRFSSLSMERELENNTNSVIPFFALNLGVMIAFCIITCMMTDWVKSKPFLGLLGIVSAVLATIAALGLVMYCGIPFIGTYFLDFVIILQNYGIHCIEVTKLWTAYVSV